jgi:hypothetical protein
MKGESRRSAPSKTWTRALSVRAVVGSVVEKVEAVVVV